MEQLLLRSLLVKGELVSLLRCLDGIACGVRLPDLHSLPSSGPPAGFVWTIAQSIGLVVIF